MYVCMYVCSDHFNKLQRIPLFTFTFIQIEQTFSHLEKKRKEKEKKKTFILFKICELERKCKQA